MIETMQTRMHERTLSASSSLWVDALGVAGLLYLGALARVPLPFTPAPFTLQTVVVLAAPFMLSPTRTFAGIALYILLGLAAQLAGTSVFAAVSGASYGYLLGFLLAPFVLERFSRSFRGTVAGMTAVSAMILLLGAAWLQFYLDCSLSQAALLGIAPFIAGDGIKIALSCALVRHAMPLRGDAA